MMSKKTVLAIVLVLGIWGMTCAAAVNDVLKADFTGTKADTVYQIVTRMGCHTTIEIPDGQKIKHFIVGDQKLWKAECDGRYAFVKPIQNGIETTLSIVTTDNHMYQFTVTEAAAVGEGNFVKKVKITCEDEEPMIKKVAAERAAPELSEKEIQEREEATFLERKMDLLRKLDYSFTIKKNRFQISKVCQDGVFTYIDLSDCQIRPAVFVATDKEKSKLEPVNFTDGDGLYTVHRVLAPGEFFLLKNGTDWSKITHR